MNHKTLRGGIAAVASAALIAALAVSTPAHAQTKAIVIGLSSDPAPTTYDPIRYSGGQRLFYESLYDSLFLPDGKNGALPGLAVSSSLASDKTTFKLTLRSGVKFQDGSALTGDVVVANLMRAVKAGANDNYASYQTFEKGGSSEITSVTADGLDVTIKFAKAQGDAAALFVGQPGMIVSAAAAANPDLMKAKPMGSGPFQLAAAGTVKANTYKETKFAANWRANQFSQVGMTYRVFQNPQAQANALATGQIDILDQVNSASVDFLKSRKIGMVQMGGHIFWMNFWNGGQNPPGHAVVGDKNVRLALSYATDRAALVKQLFKGDRPTANMVPFGKDGFDIGLDNTYIYSPSKAKQLLADAGVKNLVLNIIIGPGDVAYASAIAAQWAKVGVTLNAKVFTTLDEYFGAVGSEPFGFFDTTMANLPGFSAGVLVYGFGNFMGVKNAAVNGSLGAALGNPNAATIKALNDALVNEAWVVPLREGFAYTGYNTKNILKPAVGVDGTVVPMLADIKQK
ncbi:MAG: hypothetical protein RL243_1255 [Actinomycetota bacterium]|jgi:peptide/nickel transport system substrate-binding protein